MGILRNRKPTAYLGRSIALAFATLLAAGAAGAAWDPAPATSSRRRPCGDADPVRIAARVLDLSEEQVATWSDILRREQFAVEPLAEAIQIRERALHELLSGETPDPVRVGALVIEISRLRARIRVIRDRTAEALLATLDDEQLAIVDDVARAAELAPAVPAFETLGLI